MKIALRRTSATDATPFQAFACKVIKARLVSQFCHGAIVINGDLYQATGTRNLHKVPDGQWNPDNWLLVDIGTQRDAAALQLFADNEGMLYDLFSLLAFIGLHAQDANRVYCFEWCYWAVTGQRPTERITPEVMLNIALLRPAVPEVARAHCAEPGCEI